MRLRAFALLLMCGCAKLDEQFVCHADASCFFHGQVGRCEPSGFCSFPDALCLRSGRRYGDYAGALSGSCVAEEPPIFAGPSDAGEDSDAGTFADGAL